MSRTVYHALSIPLVARTRLKNRFGELLCRPYWFKQVLIPNDPRPGDCLASKNISYKLGACWSITPSSVCDGGVEDTRTSESTTSKVKYLINLFKTMNYF